MERFSSLVTKSRPWPVIGRTIFFTSDKNRPTRDEIYFIDFWRENLSMYRINCDLSQRGTSRKIFFVGLKFSSSIRRLPGIFNSKTISGSQYPYYRHLSSN